IVNLIEVEPGWEKIVENYLSRFGAGIVVRTFEDVLWIRDRIKGNGRVTLLAASVESLETPEIEGAIPLVSKVKPRDSRVERMVSTVFYKVYYAPGKAKELAEKYPDAVFMDEDYALLSGKGSIVGKFKGSSLLELERELKELEGELSKKADELEEVVSREVPLKEEISRLEEKIDVLREEINSLKMELFEVESKEREVSKKISDLDGRRRELEEKKARAEESVSSFERRMSMFAEKLNSLMTEKEELSRKLSELERKEENCRSKAEEVKDKLSEDTSRKLVVMEKLSSLREKLKAKERFLSSLRRELSAILNRLEKEREELKKSQEELQRATELLGGVDEALEEIREELSGLEDRRSELTGVLRDKENALKQRQKDLSEVQKRLKDTELSLARLSVREDEVVKKILDIDASVSEALLLSEGVEGEEELKKELINLKERISRIGVVNFLAIEEYEKVKERYGFILEQREDLVKSIKNLKEAIKKLDQEIEKHFTSTFRQVNRSFKRAIQTIFGGGTGKLILTSDNISEAGVEIEAKPPGKRHSNINLLSGGERTLVALAFLYALYSVKPAPFVVLDEVDAALDDANTLRFVELIKQMALETQVVIVTHNKLTMEVADQILGVTMEVPGVSKVIGVSFESLAGVV
ncbi:MAG: AAA family ATPase, partial [Desulfurobacteriaceae bacterium]